MAHVTEAGRFSLIWPVLPQYTPDRVKVTASKLVVS